MGSRVIVQPILQIQASNHLLPPPGFTPVPVEHEAGCAPESLLTFWRIHKCLASVAIRTPIFHPVAS